MSTHEQIARNATIVQRRLNGEATGALALEYGMSPTRIGQLVRRHREKAGEIPAKPRTKAAKAETAIRPRLRKVELGLWECAGEAVSRRGETPKEAYDRWIVAAISSLMHPLDQQTSPTAPISAAPSSPVDSPSPYTGPVTVVAGTKAAPRPLTLPPSMRFAMERAGLAQGPLLTLGGA